MKSRNYFLTAEQVQHLRAACDTASPRGKRDLAILDAMLFQGLRLKEVVELRMEDIRDLGNQFILHLKGRTDEIDVHDTCHQSLKTWLDESDVCLGNATGPIFVPISKSIRNPQEPLRGQTISRLAAKYGNQAGLTPLKGPNRLKPGDLRRTCARTAYDHGADLLSLQAFFGFNHLESVARYIGVLDMKDAGSVKNFIRYKVQ
jgi:site-specific recombinase XerD